MIAPSIILKFAEEALIEVKKIDTSRRETDEIDPGEVWSNDRLKTYADRLDPDLDILTESKSRDPLELLPDTYKSSLAQIQEAEKYASASVSSRLEMDLLRKKTEPGKLLEIAEAHKRAMGIMGNYTQRNLHRKVSKQKAIQDLEVAIKDLQDIQDTHRSIQKDILDFKRSYEEPEEDEKKTEPKATTSQQTELNSSERRQPVNDKGTFFAKVANYSPAAVPGSTGIFSNKEYPDEQTQRDIQNQYGSLLTPKELAGRIKQAGLDQRKKDLETVAKQMVAVNYPLPSIEKKYLALVTGNIANSREKAYFFEQYQKYRYNASPKALAKRGLIWGVTKLGNTKMVKPLVTKLDNGIQRINNTIETKYYTTRNKVKSSIKGTILAAAQEAHDIKVAKKALKTARPNAQTRVQVANNYLQQKKQYASLLRSTAYSISRINNVRILLNKRKDKYNTTGLLGLVGKLVQNRIKGVINSAKGALQATKAGSNIVKALQTTGKVVQTGGKIINGVRGTAKIAAAGLGNGAKMAAPGAIVGFLAGGLPGAIIGGLGTGAIGAVTNTLNAASKLSLSEFKNSGLYNGAKALDKLGIAAPRKALAGFWLKNNNWAAGLGRTVSGTAQRAIQGKFITNLVGGMRAANTGIWGAGIGSLVGTLVGGPAGAIAGGLLGGAAGVGGHVAWNKFENTIMKSAMANKGFQMFKALPLDHINGMVTGNQWIGSQIRILGGGADAAEQALYGWKNPLSVGLNLAQMASYIGSTYSTFGSGLFSGSINLVANKLGSIGTSLTKLGAGFNNPVVFKAMQAQLVLSDAVKVAQIAKGASIGSIVGSVAGAVIASALGLQLGLFAAIGGVVGGVVGGAIGAAVVGVGTLGIGTVGGGFLGAAVGSAGGTVFGAWLDKLFSNNLKGLPNPFSVIQGIYEFVKFLTMPIRSLSDYGQLGGMVLSLLIFFITMSKIFSTTTVTGTTDIVSSAAGVAQGMPAITAPYISNAGNQEIYLNKGSEGKYLISNVEQVATVNSSLEAPTQTITFTSAGFYWKMTSPAAMTASFDPKTGTISGNGKDVQITVYKEVAGLGGKKTLAQTQLCEAYANCPLYASAGDN